MSEKIITLLSDFGLEDYYVAEMKGVILSLNHEVKIIDICHNIKKFDIRMGGFVLACATQYFPKGTIHVAVVDPGVGSKRRPIIIESSNSLFVGPDNGLLLLAANKDGLEHVYQIENFEFYSHKISKTFHGRDIFAPIAAALTKGYHPAGFGREIKDFMNPDFMNPQVEKGAIFAEILHIDSFGNLITNIPLKMLQELNIQRGSKIQIEINGKDTASKIFSAYSDVRSGHPLVLIGSHDYLEISVNQGSAEDFYEAKRGSLVRVN